LGQFDQSQQRHEDEPYEKDGSKLTVSNPRNPSQHWSYVTLFEASIGRFRAREGADAVEIINPKRACEGPPRTTLERG
jgi:hypothetical protein